jgi:hypothetical protein
LAGSDLLPGGAGFLLRGVHFGQPLTGHTDTVLWGHGPRAAGQMVLATGGGDGVTPAMLAAALLAAPRRPDARVGIRGKTATFGQMTVIGRKSLLPAGQLLPFLGRRVTAGLPGAACRDARRQDR